MPTSKSCMDSESFACLWRDRIGFDETQFEVKAVDRRLGFKCVKPGSLVLDAGGWEAIDAGPFVVARKAKVVLLDLSLAALVRGRVHIKNAAIQGSVDPVRASVTHLPFRNGQFDVVTCFSVLDHLPRREDVVASLSEFARTLKSPGRLAVTFPNKLFLAGTLSSMFHQFLDLHCFWERRFTPKEFNCMMRNAGLLPVMYDYGTAQRMGRSMRRANVPQAFNKLPTQLAEGITTLVIAITNGMANGSKLFGPRFGIVAIVDRMIESAT